MKAKSRTSRVGAIVAAVASVAGMVFTAAPATAADYPTSTFELPYTASHYNGTATWYNRSVSVTGTFKASNCRRIYVRAFAGNTSLDFQSTSLWCNRTDTAPFTLDTNVVGGADNIWIYMTYLDGAVERNLVERTCYRSSNYCVDGLH
ncbi:hypothetical protein [Umezawaea sp. Da 62-37]|uniref:hypothetical protein n=1 Tax=Umezawaea sp. Da 62-37 TaxID=3075927 RepID=UPI0028F6E78F|nr:hypothetical protein [Umezawaea sp. Da 62-37]WNV87345.1 hypothetical protein RM788_03325 [Umezawaea sp. Da 62-37]